MAIAVGVAAEIAQHIFRAAEGAFQVDHPVLPVEWPQPSGEGLRLCKKLQELGPDHDFKLDETIPKFKGWHCFRRSLASNLYGLGVKPKVIQAILRHSDISVALDFYVEVPESESHEALDKLTRLMG